VIYLLLSDYRQAIEQEAHLRQQIRSIQRQLQLKETEDRNLHGLDDTAASISRRLVTTSSLAKTSKIATTAMVAGDDDGDGSGFVRAARRKRITEALIDLQKQVSLVLNKAE